MKITLSQINSTVGDISGNCEIIKGVLSKSRAASADLVIFPELTLTGYPPRDLLDSPSFIEQTGAGVQKLLHISSLYPETGILFGTVTSDGKKKDSKLYNSAMLIFNGQLLFTQHKSLLPTYDVFDETRYFVPGPKIQPFRFKNEVLGVSICEDAWNDPALWPRGNYSFDPLEILAKKGATLFVNISASPFYIGKEEIRFRLIKRHALRHHIPFVFVNQVGGNDELVFDGRSMFVDNSGNLMNIFPSCKEHTQTIDTTDTNTIPFIPENTIESVYKALILGIKDYMRKCGFSKALLGLSGGIDSALTCCLAKDAIGSQNVIAVSMPSHYSSKGSIDDAAKLAKNLGITMKIIPISPIFNAYLNNLESHFEGKNPDVTEENIQARIRGNILMALSNKFGYLLLSTGNKSELAVGYCTLYGDMCGGLSVIADIPKTMVYELAYFINRNAEIIPKEILKKPPSAELRPNQLDQDSLPPYDILDRILHLYLEEKYSFHDIISQGIDSATVMWVINAIKKNEYKRRQAPPGIKVSNKAFGIGRRMPIAAKYEI